MKHRSGVILAGLITLLSPLPAQAGMPEVREITVTDVTPSSFSVVWETNEPGTAGLRVFRNGCAVVEGNAEVVVHPLFGADASVKGAAEGRGVMKVMVKGLTPDTTYCFQAVTTSKSSNDTAVEPATPIQTKTQRMVVRTKMSGSDIVPFSNDMLRFDAYKPTPDAETAGILLEAAVDGAAAPVTSWVGAGVGAPSGLANLNNIFGAATGISMDLAGGERLRLREWRGAGSCGIEHFRKVPVDSGMSLVKSPAPAFIKEDVDASDCVNILDILRVVGGFGQHRGDACFNADIDLDVNDEVNILDILATVGKFGQCAP